MPVLYHALGHKIQQDPLLKELTVSLPWKEEKYIDDHMQMWSVLMEKGIEEAVGEVFMAPWRRQYWISIWWQKEERAWERKTEKGQREHMVEGTLMGHLRHSIYFNGLSEGWGCPMGGWSKTWQAQAMWGWAHLCVKLVRSAHVKQWEKHELEHWMMDIGCKWSRKGEPIRGYGTCGGGKSSRTGREKGVGLPGSEGSMSTARGKCFSMTGVQTVSQPSRSQQWKYVKTKMKARWMRWSYRACGRPLGPQMQSSNL